MTKRVYMCTKIEAMLSTKTTDKQTKRMPSQSNQWPLQRKA
jgi:hypothetical protein